MYEYIKGQLSSKNPTQVVIDVGGVGYRLNVPVSTFERLPDIGSEAKLFTYLHVREDALRLYAFATEGERALFEMLNSVSGIGTNLALTILSGVPAGELTKAIAEQNTTLLQSVKGIGKKTAQRVVLELKEKVSGEADLVAGVGQPLANEAVAALDALGVPRAAAERAVASAIDDAGSDASIEDIVRAALKLM